jgi:hypothetical protein
MVQILKHINTAPSPTMDQIETSIYHAFGPPGNIRVPGETPEKILLGVLEKKGIKSPTISLNPRPRPKSKALHTL